MEKLTDANFKEVTSAHKGPYAVEFFATWCGHCQRMEPVMEAVAQEYQGKVKIFQADVDIAQNTTSEFGVTGTPTIFYFKDGKAVDQSVGEMPLESLKEKLDALL